MMFEYLIPCEFFEGSQTDRTKKLILLGLSTCAFCKRGKAFLGKEGLAFSYVDMDKVDPALSKKAKEEFKARFGSALTYPTLLIGEDDFLTGFIEPSWRNELLN